LRISRISALICDRRRGPLRGLPRRGIGALERTGALRLPAQGRAAQQGEVGNQASSSVQSGECRRRRVDRIPGARGGRQLFGEWGGEECLSLYGLVRERPRAASLSPYPAPRGLLQFSDQRKEVVLILSHMLEGTLEVQGR
jgi:hypothetical protein